MNKRNRIQNAVPLHILHVCIVIDYCSKKNCRSHMITVQWELPSYLSVAWTAQYYYKRSLTSIFICLTNVDGYYTTLVLKSLVEIRSQEIFKRMYVSAAFFVWWLLEIVIIMVQEFCHQTYDVLTKANVIFKNFFP